MCVWTTFLCVGLMETCATNPVTAIQSQANGMSNVQSRCVPTPPLCGSLVKLRADRAAHGKTACEASI